MPCWKNLKWIKIPQLSLLAIFFIPNVELCMWLITKFWSTSVLMWLQMLKKIFVCTTVQFVHIFACKSSVQFIDISSTFKINVCKVNKHITKATNKIIRQTRYVILKTGSCERTSWSSSLAATYAMKKRK